MSKSTGQHGTEHLSGKKTAENRFFPDTLGDDYSYINRSIKSQKQLTRGDAEVVVIVAATRAAVAFVVTSAAEDS